jgi:Protein of unknown function (DUF1207)
MVRPVPDERHRQRVGRVPPGPPGMAGPTAAAPVAERPRHRAWHFTPLSSLVPIVVVGPRPRTRQQGSDQPTPHPHERPTMNSSITGQRSEPRRAAIGGLRPLQRLSMSALLLGSVMAQDTGIEDRFLAGYVAAVLERDFGLPAVPVTVVDGQVRLHDRAFGRLERQQLTIALQALPGVRGVTFLEPPVPTAASEAAPILVLSPGRLFEPLLADPRWPHFFASWHYYVEDRDRDAGTDALAQVGAAGFGETLAFARHRGGGGLHWEAGLQAGVFAIFDLDRASKDLINADYTIGPYLAGRHHDTSLLLRLRHQSSHLGDEYVLREQITGNGRVNLSYETVDIVGSHELPGGWRPYAGGSYLLAVDPAGLEPWTVHYGLEWSGMQSFGEGGGMRPVAAIDCKQRQENDWGLDASVRAGVVFEDGGRISQRFAVLLEWYDGHSPNGQFYTDRVQFLGIGLHFFF